MKKAAILGARQAGLVEVPEPVPYDDWALVKVHTAPMCAEYKAFVGGEAQAVMGHEAAGEVVAVAQPGPVKVGDRVVAMPLAGCGHCELCRSGDYIHCDQAFALSGFAGPREGCDAMAQYLLKPAWLLLPIPDDVSYERAALACCALGPSFGAFHTLDLHAGETVLVTGLGPVGLGAIVNARYREARVFAVESVPWRVQRARELGAEAVFDPASGDIVERLRSLTSGRGVDCAIDCSGSVAAERLCIDATRKKGRVAFVGESYTPLALTISPDMIRKGLTLIGAWHYNLNDFDRVMEVIRTSPLIDRLISHVIPMSRIQEAFELSASHETAKIVLTPWE
jgi:threonine dehydrogenase-like Zn-dependent dehydrogenase